MYLVLTIGLIIFAMMCAVSQDTADSINKEIQEKEREK